MKLVFILSHKELAMANFCPTRDDICIWRGDTPVIFVTIRERNADGTEGDPIDVTGYSFRMTVDVSSEPSVQVTTCSVLPDLLSTPQPAKYSSAYGSCRPITSVSFSTIYRWLRQRRLFARSCGGSFDIIQDISKLAP